MEILNPTIHQPIQHIIVFIDWCSKRRIFRCFMFLLLGHVFNVGYGNLDPLCMILLIWVIFWVWVYFEQNNPRHVRHPSIKIVDDSWKECTKGEWKNNQLNVYISWGLCRLTFYIYILTLYLTITKSHTG